MKKNLKYYIFILLLLPCCLLFGGCELVNNSVYVTDIVKSGTDGTYTITYSDGRTSTITINDGKDGKDGANSSVDINELFESCVEKGLYANTTDGYHQFIIDYFSPDYSEIATKLAINKGLQSAVSVYAAYQNKNNYQNQPAYSISAGAGVIVSMDDASDVSYIVTNYHVVYATDNKSTNKISNDIAIYQYGVTEDIAVGDGVSGRYLNYEFGSNAVKCTYIGGSMNYDIAVLKTKTSDLKANGKTPLAATMADGYSVGETAVAIGNPNAEGISVTKGIISVDSEILQMKGADETTTVNFRVMRIDTSVNGGNSGGGLFDIDGNLIGIVNAKALYSLSGTDLENMAYALPIDNVKNVINNIIYNYTQSGTAVGVKKLVVGITVTGQNGKAVYDEKTGEVVVTNELLVSAVEANSIAANLGIKAGDVIKAITINGTTYTINRHFQFGDLLLNVRPGNTVQITVKTQSGEKTWGPITITSAQLTTIK